MQFVMHRLRMSNYFSVIIVGLFLVACSYEIELDVKIDSECNVDVAFLKGLPQIEYVLVAEPKGEGFAYNEPVWEINGNYKKVESIRYGQLPEGFDEVFKPLPLVPGKSYYFVVKGSGGGFGAVEFVNKCLTSVVT